MPLALPAVKKVVQFVVESKKNTPMSILFVAVFIFSGGFYSVFVFVLVFVMGYNFL